MTDPFKGCDTLKNPDEIHGKIAILERGGCMFIDKARLLQAAGAVGGIVIGEYCFKYFHFKSLTTSDSKGSLAGD